MLQLDDDIYGMQLLVGKISITISVRTKQTNKLLS